MILPTVFDIPLFSSRIIRIINNYDNHPYYNKYYDIMLSPLWFLMSLARLGP